MFFLADREKSGKIKIQYCPTDDIIGGYFTKPLQGAKLRKFWQQILNIKPDGDVLNQKNGINAQECVGE